MENIEFNVSSRSKRIRKPVTEESDLNYLQKYLEDNELEGESSDDSEYVATSNSSGGEGLNDGDENDDDDDSNESSSDSNEDDDNNETSDDEKSEKSTKQNETSNGKSKIKEKDVKVKIKEELYETGLADDETETKVKSPSTLPAKDSVQKSMAKHSIFDLMICMVCLGDQTGEENEIVECDACGITVHEACYGVSDNLSISSTGSSSNTEPWFCEACLAFKKDPLCELCPTKGGVFKRTDDNRWVHLLCALYTPGIAFNNPEALSEVTLTEISPKEWSSKECQVCVERLYACTGICISCDAGLCKGYFHVTCAQKEGLLSEPNHEENPSDPYFAHCRQHTDKVLAKSRKRNLVMAQRRQKDWLEKRQRHLHLLKTNSNPSPSVDEEEKVDFPGIKRIQNKLAYMQEKYKSFLNKRIPPYAPVEKTPRFLETSPVAVRLFLQKSAYLNLPNILTSQAVSDQNKSATGYPVFSPEFVSYFMERERKIDDMNARISELDHTQRELRVSDDNTSHQFNRVVNKSEKERSEMLESVNKLKDLIGVISRITPSIDLTRLHLLVTRSMSFLTSGSRMVRDNAAASITEEATTPTKEQLPKEEIPSSSNVFHECTKCHCLHDQHLLALCDHCHKHFHLACLEPPLQRMPKKSRSYGWECSWCTKAQSSDSEAAPVDIHAPRKTRGKQDNKLIQLLKESYKSRDSSTPSSRKRKSSASKRSRASNKKAKVDPKCDSPPAVANGTPSDTAASISKSVNARLYLSDTSPSQVDKKSVKDNSSVASPNGQKVLQIETSDGVRKTILLKLRKSQ